MSSSKIYIGGLDNLDTSGRELPTVSGRYMKLQEDTVTIERRIKPTEKFKEKTSQIYQSRIRQVLVLYIEFDPSATEYGLLQLFKANKTIRVPIYTSGTQTIEYLTEDDDTNIFKVDLMRHVEAEDSLATLSIQLSRYSVWEDDALPIASENMFSAW